MNKKLKLAIVIALNVAGVEILWGYLLFFSIDMAPMEGLGIKLTFLSVAGFAYGIFLWKNRNKDGYVTFGIEKYFKKTQSLEKF
jgi:hypothetical protein